MNSSIKKKTSVICTATWVTALASFAAISAAGAQTSVISKNSGVSPESALIPVCGTDASGDGDGAPKVKGDPDGAPKVKGDADGAPKIKGDPDGKGKLALKASALTTSTSPDLAISRVNATLESRHYTLSYCVFNRGGKPAFSPTALVVQAGDVVLQELTIFDTIPSLGGLCFGSADREQLPPTAKTSGATIQVTAATGETALVNNKCRIQWGK